MSTSTFSATVLGYVRGTSSSSWDRSAAFQGKYGNTSTRVGAMLFSTLHSVDWTMQDIQSISIQFRFGPAGGNYSKWIGLYRGAKKGGISGTGSSMMGAKLGDVKFSNAYNAASTATFNENANAGIFAQLVEWLKAMQTDTIAIYVNETSVGSNNWSSNYAKVEAANLIIEYRPRCSDGTLDKGSVNAGQTITATVIPPDTEDSAVLTHDVKWSFGSYSTTQSLAADELTAALTVPMDWLNVIPGAASGNATCTITTYADGTLRGEIVLPFTITAPSSAAPDLSVQIAPAGKVTAGYYQYLSAAKITANASGKYGASIVSYAISGSEGATGSASALTTAAFLTSGSHTYAVTVTDSRGMKATKNVSCNVIAVARPNISTFKVERYSTIQGDETTYVATDYGPNVWITLNATFDSAGGYNKHSAYIDYGQVGGSKTRVNLTISNGKINLANARNIITATISPNSAYEFTLVCSDSANTATSYALIAEGRCLMHLAGSGFGVGFGRFVDEATESNPMLACAWPAQFEEDVHVDGTLALGENASTHGLYEQLAEISDAHSVSIPNSTTTTIDTVPIEASGLYMVSYLFEGSPSTANKLFQIGVSVLREGSDFPIASESGPTITGLYQKTVTAFYMLNAGESVVCRIQHFIGSTLSGQWKKNIIRIR